MHELLTVDFARYHRANNGEKMNTKFNNENIEQGNNLKTQKSYSCNKASVNNKNSNNITYKNEHNIVKSTIMLLSWLFVFVLSAFLIYFTNIEDSTHQNTNLVAEGQNTFKDVAISAENNGASEETAFKLSTYEDLLELTTLFNGSTGGNDNGYGVSYRSAYYKLMKDIEVKESVTEWQAIGYTSDFTGIFDGQGYTITFLGNVLQSTPMMWGGFFGSTRGTSAKYCEILNLGINWAGGFVMDSKAGGFYGGGIVGLVYEYTKITNCWVKGSLSVKMTGSVINPSVSLGGIVGTIGYYSNYGDGVEINNCYSEATITTGKTVHYNYMGGIVGSRQNSSNNYIFIISNSYNLGDIDCVNNSTKQSFSLLLNNQKDENGRQSMNSNLLTATPLATATTKISGSAGGIIGNADDNTIIVNCYNTGKISAKDTNTTTTEAVAAGGISGANGTIVNCISAVGSSSNAPTASKGTATSYVFVGGIVGSGGAVSTSYYDYGLDNDTASGDIAKPELTTNNDIKNGDTYKGSNGYSWTPSPISSGTISIDCDWNFDETWGIDKSGEINNGYPYLKAFYPNLSIIVNFSITTNVGAIINIIDESGANVQQVYINASSNAQNIQIELLSGIYKAVISTYYTSNITTTINSVQTKGNIITFDVSNANAITIVINGFIGNNGVII